MVAVDVYRCSGHVSRSVLSAELVETVFEELPEDEIHFADEHDGDFVVAHTE